MSPANLELPYLEECLPQIIRQITELGRKIEDYPPMECDVFVLEVVKEVLSTDTQELVEELKKVLQMNRITSALKNMVFNSIERLYRKGVLKKEKHKIIYVSEII